MSHRISLGRFELDPSRGCLLSDGREIPLRPHTFSVLAYLAARPGQRVPTDEIVEAVWPGVIGSDDHLVQSIGELRRVFGDGEGRLIQYDLEQGAILDPAGAAPERRHAHGVQPLRFRWMYGLIAPLVLAIAFALIWFTTSRGPVVPEASAHPAIAVLPFQNQSDDPAVAAQADRFTQSLIVALGRYPAFRVRSWDEVAFYKGALAQPGEIARVLAVRYQVEGSVRYAGGQIRVSAQLVDLQGQVLWSSRHVEPAAREAELLAQIVTELVDALDLVL
jgi:TolB-like protein